MLADNGKVECFVSMGLWFLHVLTELSWSLISSAWQNLGSTVITSKGIFLFATIANSWNYEFAFWPQDKMQKDRQLVILLRTFQTPQCVIASALDDYTSFSLETDEEWSWLWKITVWTNLHQMGSQKVSISQGHVHQPVLTFVGSKGSHPFWTTMVSKQQKAGSCEIPSQYHPPFTGLVFGSW